MEHRSARARVGLKSSESYRNQIARFTNDSPIESQIIVLIGLCWRSESWEEKLWILNWSPSILIFWLSFSYFTLCLIDREVHPIILLSSEFAYIKFWWRHAKALETSQIVFQFLSNRRVRRLRKELCTFLHQRQTYILSDFRQVVSVVTSKRWLVTVR